MAFDSYIKVLTAADLLEYNLMLKDAFGTAVGLKAEQQTLVWTPTDDYYTVLGLYFNGQLKSMMRIEWIDSENEFKIKIDEDEIPLSLDFPMGYLAKAATATDCKNKNFNSLLRYHCLNIFCTWKVDMVLGVIAADSPRQKTMASLGYEFYKKSKKWNGNFKSDRMILMGFLKTNHDIFLAMEKLKDSLGPLINQFPLSFNYHEIRRTGRIKLVFPWTKRAS